MNNINYYLNKDKKTGEILFLEYDKIEGYNIKPKKDIENGIKVNKIVFVNPSLSEKLIRKKIEIKINYFLKMLEGTDDDTEGGIDALKNTLMQAEKLRIMIINNYVKYLGNTYKSLTLKKLQIIIEELKMKLFDKVNVNKKENLYYLDEEEYKQVSKRGGR